jgi:hypothetical protein
MLLSQKDISRLEKLGFPKTYFVKFDRQGFAQLKNMDEYCVFYDRGNRRCSVYEHRPSGCRVYPVILDEETGIILDDICSERDTISVREKEVKGKKVIKLLEQIDAEAANRRQLKNR